VRSESHCALKLRYVDLVVSIKDVIGVCFNELKSTVTALITNISQADLQKVTADKIKLVQACIDTSGHHFQHVL
jgi:hypothetical protein